MLTDSYGRTIDYIRISVTDRCNYRCFYCMPEGGVKLIHRKELLSYEEIAEVIKQFAAKGVSKLRLTGGEPLIRSDIEKLIKMLSSIRGIKKIAMTTNGSLLENKAAKLKANGLNSVTVSLDTLNNEKFEKLTRMGIVSDVVCGIDEAIRIGLDLKLNTVLLRGINENELDELISFAFKRDITIRFIELMPADYDIGFYKKRFMPISYVSEFVKKRYDAKPSNYRSAGPASYVEINGHLIGFISAVSVGFCDNCNRIRLASNGKIYPCLGHMEEYSVDFKKALGKGESIDDLIKKLLEIKPKSHNLLNLSIKSSMSMIGG